jgi:hypothetical protein
LVLKESRYKSTSETVFEGFKDSSYGFHGLELVFQEASFEQGQWLCLSDQPRVQSGLSFHHVPRNKDKEGVFAKNLLV